MSSKKTYQDPYAKREAERYENPVPSREAVLQVLADKGRPLTADALTDLLGVEDRSNRMAFGFRLKAMLRDGQLLENRAGKLGIIEQMDLLPGTVEAHKEGYGFVLLDAKKPDLFLPPRQLQKVMHGDRVLVSENYHRYLKRSEAHIVEITERAVTQVVGRFHQEGSAAWVLPDNKQLRFEALIANMNGFTPQEGDHLVASIEQYPTARHSMRVKIEEVIASPDDAGMEIEVALRSFDLPFTWPADVTEQLKRIPDSVAAKEAKGRADLRDLPFVTIDGEDARDFDDAIHVSKRPRGGWRLMVAIADVGHYVRPGSALDNEAVNRGTSVYFPSRVIPMLPEKLSNGLCSLNPDVDRLCLYCDMLISANGRISRYAFGEGIIRSHYRFTYTQVGAYLEQAESDAAQTLYQTLSSPLQTQLVAFHQLYLTLRAQRENRGAIDFDRTETRVLFDDQLKIRNIVPATRNVAHTMIEEAMLAANTCAARLLKEEKLPTLFRNHEPPKQDRLANLQAFLEPLGLHLDWDGKSDPAPATLQALGAQIASRPDKDVIQVMMLRSLTQAKYESTNKGHFGLAYPYYAHFTSPIRRYPDLLVHRALRYLIREGRSKRVMTEGTLKPVPRQQILPYNDKQMLELGEHCSMTERRADDASRDVMKWLKCQFMEQHLGSTFSGTISGVTNFGLFVELDDIHIDGLLHIANLGDDYFRFDQNMMLLRGRASGYEFRLGDAVEVRIAAVLTDDRKIDLQLVSHQPSGKKAGKHSGKTARKKAGGKKPVGKKTHRKGPPHGKKGPPRGKKSQRRVKKGK